MSRAAVHWKRRAWVAAKALLSAAVLVALFSGIEWTALSEAIRTASWMGISLAVCLLPVQLGLRVIRWKNLLRSVGASHALNDVVRTIMAGYAFAVVTPAEVGDVALRMHVHDDRSRSQIAGLVVLEKLLHSLLSLVLGLPALVVVMTGNVPVAVLLTLILSAAVVLLLRRHQDLARVSWSRWWVRLRVIDEGAAMVASVPRAALAHTALATGAILAVYVLQEYALVNAVTTLGVVETWFAFWAGIGLRTLAPFFVMDLGIREASHVVFFGQYGVSAATAMAVSLLMFGVNVLLPTVAGLVVFLTDHRGRS